MKDLRSLIRRTIGRRVAPSSVGLFDELDDTAFVRSAYCMILGREVDPLGLQGRLSELRRGTLDRQGICSALRHSPEMRQRVMQAQGAIALSRRTFIQSLPRARRILDLGGASHDDPRGGLVSQGYPYHFESLTIVDLPNHDRHPMYRTDSAFDSFESDQGRILYRFHDMADLTSYPSGHFDLVYSGQSFEHISRHSGEVLLSQLSRIIADGGVLALDTPNRRATEIELRCRPEQFIDPDHKVEYRAEELEQMFADASLRIERRHGLSLLPSLDVADAIGPDDIARNPGLFDDARDCYILAYVVSCDEPTPTAR